MNDRLPVVYIVIANQYVHSWRFVVARFAFLPVTCNHTFHRVNPEGYGYLSHISPFRTWKKHFITIHNDTYETNRMIRTRFRHRWLCVMYHEGNIRNEQSVNSRIHITITTSSCASWFVKKILFTGNLLDLGIRVFADAAVVDSMYVHIIWENKAPLKATPCKVPPSTVFIHHPVDTRGHDR